MTKKKSNVSTAATLQTKSENAIGAFKGLILGLKATNEEAEVARAANSAQIAALQAENDAIEILSDQNTKIIQNIEKLLNV